MKKLLCLFVVFFSSFQSWGQEEDLIGSGRAIAFDGIDDYIDLGNIYDDLSLPVTISVWVKVNDAPHYASPVFNSQDNLPIYNGITFVVQSNRVSIQYGNGNGENNPAFRRGKSAAINDISDRWANVTAVMRGASDMDLFVNGIDVGGSYDGSSTLPMQSNSPGDNAKIGYWLSNGITTHFKGSMDELRIFNRSLSAHEIREQMCKSLTGAELGLIGYWTFNEISGNTLKDKSPNNFDGSLYGDPKRVYSGAPIGDESVFLYTNDWSGKSLTKDDLSVTWVSGNPDGIHIYSVNDFPSQTGGLPSMGVQVPYYGIFLTDGVDENTFDLDFLSDSFCASFQRSDNSEPDWDPSESLSTIHERVEIIPVIAASDLTVDLGPDRILCDVLSVELQAGTASPGKTFLWNTGETSPTISATAAGSFSVLVMEGCKMDRDTIHLTFLHTPPVFSLGEDEVLCTMEPRLLTPGLEGNDYEFTWQDGSSEKQFLAGEFQTYWLKIENACGIAVDSVTFAPRVLSEIKQYNFISPDNQDDRNEFFTLDERLVGSKLAVFNRWGKKVYHSLSYQNNWEGNGLPAGIYYYIVIGDCIEPLKGTLTIMR